MKTALIAAIAGFLLHSHSAYSAERVWVDEWCMSVLTDKSDLKFEFIRTDGTGKDQCQVTIWPLDTPVADMKCSAGPAKLELTQDGSAIFNGIMMYPRGDARVLCD